MKEKFLLALTCLSGGIVLAAANAHAIPCLANNMTACLATLGRGCAATLLQLLFGLLFLKVACACGESALAYGRRRLELVVCASSVRRVFSRVIRTSPSFFDRVDAEDTVRRILRDSETLAAWRVATWLELPLALTGVALAMATMFCGGSDCPALGLSAQRGCPALAAVVLLLAPTHFLFLCWNRRFACEEHRQARSSEAQYAVGIEILRGIVDLRSANAFSFADERLANCTDRSIRAQSRVQEVMSILQGTDNVVAAVAEIAFVTVAARMIFAFDVRFGYADYVGFIALQMAFHAALSRIVDMAFSWMKAKPARTRIRELEQLPVQFGNAAQDQNESTASAPEIGLNHVTMVTSGGTNVLSDVCLRVSGGSHMAVVGKSGCGKSTLLKIAARQLEPTSGEVWLDGRRADKMPLADYVSRVALVSQRPFMFAGTVRDNILLGRADREDGVRLNRIAAGIGIPPDLLDRIVRTDGRGLSGGQMAKVALARAAYGDPQVLLLDEVTAALDDQSERRVLDFLAGECRHCTILFVSHRHTSTEAMDAVYTFSDEGSGYEGE